MVGYEVTELLGRGGMGEVYRGRHLGLDRPVAIKFLRSSLAEDPEFRERFLREARLSARLSHPHVVQVYDTGLEGDRPYLVMELLEGESLHARLKRGALPQEEAIAVARQALAALARAHSQGIVHRDIKPGNIFLCRDGTVKVMDFGIARALDEVRLTQTGTQMGTAEYMSPEQVEGQATDARSDLYAMGIVLHEMVTGEVPFAAATPLSVMHQQVTRPTPGLPDWVFPGVREVAARALAKSSADRFPSAEAMIQALEGRPAASPDQRAAPDARFRPAVGREASPSGENARTNHRAASILGALTLVLIGLFGAYSLNGQNRDHSPIPAPADTTGQSPSVALPVQTGFGGGTTSGRSSASRSSGSEDRPAEHSGGGKTDDSDHPRRSTEAPPPKREPETREGERFPETATRLLTAGEVSAWPADDLRYAVNEIYARHGRDFVTRPVRQQFLKFEWYRRVLVPGRRDVSPFLSGTERQNLALMTRIRDAGRAGG
jgi:serine/threonine protein kinase